MLQYNVIKETDIPQLRKKRHKTKFGSCYMTRGIFASAAGKLTCSCMIGYFTELADIRNTHVGDFCSGPIIEYIKNSFSQGYEPFPLCRHCVSKESKGLPENWLGKKGLRTGIILHIEPSTYCNLFCEACLCTHERKAINVLPRRLLSFDLYSKMIRELKEGDIPVGNIIFAGFGEPLFNTDLPKMVGLARKTYPSSHISLDTNANFGINKAKEIANCGLDQIRLALDGADQESYSTYRRQGDFQLAINFAKSLSTAIKTSNSKTKAIWKYILFKHNDSDDLLKTAKRMADEYGIEINYDVSVGDLASQRDIKEIESLNNDIIVSRSIDADDYNKVHSQG